MYYEDQHGNVSRFYKDDEHYFIRDNVVYERFDEEEFEEGRLICYKDLIYDVGLYKTLPILFAEATYLE